MAIEGKLRYSSWEREGQRRSKLEVIVDEVEFLSPRGQGGQQQGGYSAQQAPAYSAPAPQAYGAPAPQPSYGAPSYGQVEAPAYAAPSYGVPAAPAQQPATVQAPPSAEVYDEDIPF